MYHLMNNKEKNSYVRRQISETLLDLLQTQDISSISVSMLVDRANVGRASFYRNYKSTEDVLRREADRLMTEWKNDMETKTISAPNDYLIYLLDFYKEHRHFYLTLCKAGFSDVILQTILREFKITEDLSNAEAYLKSSIAYMMYGWVAEWMKRGMPESGTELALLFAEAEKHQKDTRL